MRVLDHLIFLAVIASASHLVAAEPLQFNRDIRPILTENCYYCHGPDKNHREADLRLDVREAAVEDGAIVPGKPTDSELIARILTDDEDDLMPPPKSHKMLKPREKALLKQWIEEGAEYQGHWAFETPVRPEVPQAAGAETAIDAFVLRRLKQENLTLSPTADRRTLIRRLSLDLIGLPPTPAEVEAFVEDTSANAYEKVVDRLMKSPAYGEHMAAQWLDFARYADSHGFQTDSSRIMWPWRDWVIRALNDNMPFDQFTIEQLAGDLLPKPELQQVVATGFHRNHRINGEGGIIDEEWRIENIIDRVDTTGATWMGLTLGCARCHDHKYDPISQKEFYELFAFFNNVDETGVIRGGSNRIGGNPGPSIFVPDNDEQKTLAQLERAVREAEARVQAAAKTLPTLVKDWEPKFQRELAESKPQWEPLMPTKVHAKAGTTFTRIEDGTYLAGGKTPNKETFIVEAPLPEGTFSGLRLNVLPDPSLPTGSVGRNSNGNFVLTRIEAEIQAPSLAKPIHVTFTDAAAVYSQDGWHVSSLIREEDAKNARRKIDAKIKRGRGWAVSGTTRKEPNQAMVLVRDGVTVPADARITVRLVQDSLNKHQVGRFSLDLCSLPPDMITLEGDGAAPANIREILALDPAKRNAKQKQALTAFFRSGFDSPVKRADVALAKARKAHEGFESKLPSVMVMKELPEPRAAHILLRGEYDKAGDEVFAATPAILPSLPQKAPRNRLTLAKWLVSPDHPLTSRVWVNRQWERFFGKGIVKSSENFGVQSDPPSHPDLLDWLATEFMQQGWDMKHLQKQIVMSATYRQSSALTNVAEELLERDPENRLLAYGPRLRLPAESIRDQALSISGLLDPTVGGPSVRPYMPEGVWDETSVYGNLRNYKPDLNGGLYRRTLYTIWKRTAAPPTMLLFDSPSRETCTVKRPRTNTPLQALALLNEVTYVEAARVLAQRMITDGGTQATDRIQWAFHRATGRNPDEHELKILHEGLQRHLRRYQTHAKDAEQLIQTGEAPVPDQAPTAELAAYTVTANVILNLDEVVTRE